MTTTLITGANKGLGFETARQLLAAGHTVYVGARDEEKAKRAAKELGALPLLIDITDDASVQAAAQHVREAGHGLDVLVNNAGVVGSRASALEATAADIAAALDTNVVGLVRVMHAFLPQLLESPRGVVVNVGSGLGSMTWATDPERMESGHPQLSYGTSKAAISMLTVQYAKAFPQLIINVVDPGYTATDLNGNQGTQTVEQGAVAIVRAALPTGAAPSGTFTNADGPVPW